MNVSAIVSWRVDQHKKQRSRGLLEFDYRYTLIRSRTETITLRKPS